MNVIVVGVDHSPGAKAALVFANEEARLRGATLRAVHAWQYGYIGYTGLEGRVPANRRGHRRAAHRRRSRAGGERA